MPADIRGLKPHVRKAVEEFQTLFPEFEVISGYRDPKHNHGVGGAGDSRHIHADAFDFKPRANVSDERKADAVNWLRSRGAMGFGTYDKVGSSFHADWRASGPAMWGPNRSRTSLDRTPDWFQGIAKDHFAGKAAPTQLATVPPGSIPTAPRAASQTFTAAAPASGNWNTARAVYDRLTGLGVAPKTAAGAVGSLMGESGKRLDPLAINPGDNARSRVHPDSIGFGQWNDTRAIALRNLAREMGSSWQDPKVQVEHLARELQGSHKHVLADLQKAGDSIEGGAGIWTRKYEVAAPQTAHQDRRVAMGYDFASTLGQPVTPDPRPNSQVAATGMPDAQTRSIAAAPSAPAAPQGLFPGMKPGILQQVAAAINPTGTAQARPLDYPPTTGSTEQRGWPHRSAWDIIKDGFGTATTSIPRPNPDGINITRPGDANSSLPSIFNAVPGPLDRFQQPRPTAPEALPVPPRNVAPGITQVLGPALQPPIPQPAPQPQPSPTPFAFTPPIPDQAQANSQPLVIKGIRPTSQDTMQVPLPPQRPSNDQLFPEVPPMPRRPIGAIPAPQPQGIPSQGPFWADSYARMQDGSLGRVQGGGLLGALGIVPTSYY